MYEVGKIYRGCEIKLATMATGFIKYASPFIMRVPWLFW